MGKKPLPAMTDPPSRWDRTGNPVKINEAMAWLAFLEADLKRDLLIPGSTYVLHRMEELDMATIETISEAIAVLAITIRNHPDIVAKAKSALGNRHDRMENIIHAG